MTSPSVGDGTGRPSARDARGVGGRRTATVSFEVYSFVMFCALCLGAMALFSGSYVVFVLIVAVDGLATLLNIDSVVSVDRSAFFLVLLLLSVERDTGDLFFLFLEVVLVIVALDVSFLLRRLHGTLVSASLISSRLKSYAYTVIPALLLSYSLTYLYSFASGFPTSVSLVLLAVSSTGTLFTIYAVSRYLASRSFHWR